MSQVKNKYNMPSKLEGYIQNQPNANLKKIKLPSIYELSGKDKADRALNIKLKQQRKQQSAQSNLTYSRKIPDISKRSLHQLKTQQSKDYKQLTKMQESIMMQIKNIDVCLETNRHNHEQKQKQKTSLYGGFIFLNEVNELVVDRFHQCLKVQQKGSFVVVDGFQLQKYIIGIDGLGEVVQGEIVKRVRSINNKMLDKSIKAIKQYDQQKNYEYEKHNGKDWSMYRRILPHNHYNYQNDSKILLQSSLLPTSLTTNNESKLSFINHHSKTKNQSKSTNLFESKLTSSSKKTYLNYNFDQKKQLQNHSYLNEGSFLNRSRETKRTKHSISTNVKTQPAQQNEFDGQGGKIAMTVTKKDVKMMLSRNKSTISMWLPPSSYPQFYGIFSYKIIKSSPPSQQFPQRTIYRCKLTRYFFYKFGLSQKVFDSIIEWVSYQTNLIIESLQINCDKDMYNRVFAKLGWTLKFWQSAHRIKANYINKKQKQLQDSQKEKTKK